MSVCLFVSVCERRLKGERERVCVGEEMRKREREREVGHRADVCMCVTTRKRDIKTERKIDRWMREINREQEKRERERKEIDRTREKKREKELDRNG